MLYYLFLNYQTIFNKKKTMLIYWFFFMNFEKYIFFSESLFNSANWKTFPIGMSFLIWAQTVQLFMENKRSDRQAKYKNNINNTTKKWKTCSGILSQFWVLCTVTHIPVKLPSWQKICTIFIKFWNLRQMNCVFDTSMI